MNNEQRKLKIIERLQNSEVPISATSFAKEFSVTRQIIVADIALLRAKGHPIRSEHKGYVLEKQNSTENFKRIVVKHGSDLVKEELYTVVDNGGRVIDVIVEHKIYGRISAELNLSSRYDVDNFVSNMSKNGTNPLSLLTEGLHIHTIDVKDEDAFNRIISKLKKLKILVEHE